MSALAPRHGPESGPIGAGFADPVAEAQTAFRAVLDAMARPGRIVALPAPAGGPPDAGGLAPAAAALALTLVDLETPVWLDPALGEAVAWLRFHCGAPLVEDPVLCRFAFARGFRALPALDRFDLGSEEYPDRSTTLVLEVDGLERGTAVTLTGPGIAATAGLDIAGVPPGWWAARAALGTLFPRGLDLVLVAGTRLAALPRTTRVEV